MQAAPGSRKSKKTERVRTEPTNKTRNGRNAKGGESIKPEQFYLKINRKIVWKDEGEREKPSQVQSHGCSRTGSRPQDSGTSFKPINLGTRRQQGSRQTAACIGTEGSGDFSGRVSQKLHRTENCFLIQIVPETPKKANKIPGSFFFFFFWCRHNLMSKPDKDIMRTIIGQPHTDYSSNISQ